MPNNVINRIYSDKETLFKIFKKDSEGRFRVDFNDWIPQPEFITNDSVPLDCENFAKILFGDIDFSLLLKTEEGESSAENSADTLINRMAASNTFKMLLMKTSIGDFDDDKFETFINMLRAKRTCGNYSWYDWNRSFWGTKWNAYDTVVDEPTFQFETAWNAPFPVIDKIVETLKPDRLVHQWADEDLGRNVGMKSYKRGEDGTYEIEEEELSDTDRGLSQAIELNDAYEFYKWDDENLRYVPIEDEDE